MNDELINRDTVIRNSRTTNLGTDNVGTRFRTGVKFLNSHFEDIFLRTEFIPEFDPPRARGMVFENCYIKENEFLIQAGFGFKMINCTLDGTKVKVAQSSDDITIENTNWINMTGDIIESSGSGNEIALFGGSSRNGSTSNLSSWVSGSGVTYSQPAGYTQPRLAPPFQLYAMAESNGDVNLDWGPHYRSNLANYDVYWTDTSDGVFQPIASGLTSSRYTDANPNSGSDNFYKVIAVDTDGIHSQVSGKQGMNDNVPYAVYSMEEFVSGKLRDASSTSGNRDLTLYGGLSASDLVPGRVGQGMDFDGVNDYASYNFSDTVWSNGYTISLWVRPDTINQPTFTSVFSNDSASNDFQIEADGTSYEFRPTTTTIGPIVANQWTHLAVSYNPVGPRTYLYYNGELVGNLLGVAHNNFGEITVGTNRSRQHCFDGTIDEVKVYNTRLTHAEVRELYHLNP